MSSWPPGAWSMLSRPPRDVRRSSDVSCVTSRSCSSRSTDTAIDERQQVSIEVRFGFLGRFIVDPMLAKLFAWPLSPIAITVNRGAAILPDQLRILLDNGLGREWGFALAYGIE